MKLIIEEVLNKKSLKKFIQFQLNLYKSNEFWVPPLISDEIKTLSKDKNPAFEFCESKLWMVLKDDKVVGRVAGIINHKFNEKVNKKYARFGWIDFIDDYTVSELLLSTVENWAKEKGMEYINGPLGFTDMDGEGLLVEGFDQLSTFGSIYNFPYYPQHLERFNYKKDSDWIEFRIELEQTIPDKVFRIAEIVKQKEKLKVVDVKKSKDLLPYARQIFYLINEAYRDLYGFVELNDKQIDMYVKSYFGFIKPGFVPLVVNEKNELVAFGISMPSLSKAMKNAKGKYLPFGIIHLLKALRSNDTADLYLTAVKPELQNKGVNAIIMCEINKAFLKNNIRFVETNRELEDNTKIQSQWRYYNAVQHKRRRCYIKNIF